MVTMGLLACIALMLAVIGGTYVYDTLLGKAQPAFADGAGTDKGPEWSVTAVKVDANQDYLVVIAEGPSPLDTGTKSKQMAVYQLRPKGQDGKGEIFLVGARTIEYDLRLEDVGNVNAKDVRPREIKKQLEKK
jgi:hypothetical protein